MFELEWNLYGSTMRTWNNKGAARIRELQRKEIRIRDASLL